MGGGGGVGEGHVATSAAANPRVCIGSVDHRIGPSLGQPKSIGLPHPLPPTHPLPLPRPHPATRPPHHPLPPPPSPPPLRPIGVLRGPRLELVGFKAKPLRVRVVFFSFAFLVLFFFLVLVRANRFVRRRMATWRPRY